jgi:tetratricopeptide (TPR) repeat protein
VLDETEHIGDLAFALVTAAFSLRGVDSIERTMSHAERGLALYRRSDDRFGLARALIFAARVSLHVFGDSAKAEAQYREAVAIQKACGDGSVVLPLSLAGLGQALMLQGEQAEGLVLIREGLSIAESFEDPWSMLSCLNAMALTERSLGNYAAAEAAARRSLALCSRFGCERASTWGCLMLADALKEQGRLDEAEANYRAALTRGASDAVIQASARVDLGNIALARGDMAAARELLSASLGGFEAIRNRWGTVIALDCMATLHCRENDPAAAEQLLRRGLDLALAARGKWLALNVIAGLALVRALQGHALRAVELLGRVQTHPSTEHSTRTRRVAPLLEELRARLPAAEFDAALARGAELALSAAFD